MPWGIERKKRDERHHRPENMSVPVQTDAQFRRLIEEKSRAGMPDQEQQGY